METSNSDEKMEARQIDTVENEDGTKERLAERRLEARSCCAASCVFINQLGG